MPLDLIGNLFSAGASIVNTKQTNKMNYKIAQETNEANRKLVEMQNQAAKDEAELAYKRSSAGNQVNLMRHAGMSRAGAINALNGGGSYTPAPVNTSQDSAPQMQAADLSALANIGQGIAERQHQKKMQEKQLQAAKEQQKEQLDSNERIAQMQIDSQNRNADNRLKYERLALDRELQFKNEDLQFRKEQYNYGKKLIDAQVGLTNAQKDDIRAKLDDFKSDPATNARKAEYQMREMAALYGYRVNENEFYSYLRDNFVKGEDGNYYPLAKMSLGSADQGAKGTLRDMGEIANEFWTMMFSIVPVKPLLDCIKLFGN